MPKGGNTNRIRHSAEQSHRSECNTSPEEFGLQVRCHDLFCFLNDCKRRMRNPDWDFPVWTPYCSDQRLTVLARVTASKKIGLSERPGVYRCAGNRTIFEYAEVPPLLTARTL